MHGREMHLLTQTLHLMHMIAFEKFVTLCRLQHTYCAHLQFYVLIIGVVSFWQKKFLIWSVMLWGALYTMKRCILNRFIVLRYMKGCKTGVATTRCSPDLLGGACLNSHGINVPHRGWFSSLTHVESTAKPTGVFILFCLVYSAHWYLEWVAYGPA